MLEFVPDNNHAKCAQISEDWGHHKCTFTKFYKWHQLWFVLFRAISLASISNTDADCISARVWSKVDVWILRQAWLRAQICTFSSVLLSHLFKKIQCVQYAQGSWWLSHWKASNFVVQEQPISSVFWAGVSFSIVVVTVLSLSILSNINRGLFSFSVVIQARLPYSYST